MSTMSPELSTACTVGQGGEPFVPMGMAKPFVMAMVPQRRGDGRIAITYVGAE